MVFHSNVTTREAATSVTACGGIVFNQILGPDLHDAPVGLTDLLCTKVAKPSVCHSNVAAREAATPVTPPSGSAFYPEAAK